MPSAHCFLAAALHRASSPSLEVVVAGSPDADDTRALLAAARARYRPHLALLVVPPGPDGAAVRELAPFVAGHRPEDGRAAAYVCRDFSCQLPTTDPAELSALLDEKTGAES
jgi:hypothetical protein